MDGTCGSSGLGPWINHQIIYFPVFSIYEQFMFPFDVAGGGQDDRVMCVQVLNVVMHQLGMSWLIENLYNDMGVLFPSYIWKAIAVVSGINHIEAYCVTKFTYDQWSMNSVDIDYYPCAVPLASLIRCDQLYTCPFLPLYLHFDCLVFRLNSLFIVSWLYKRSLFIFAICPSTWSVGLCGICLPSLIIIIIICFCSSKKNQMNLVF